MAKEVTMKRRPDPIRTDRLPVDTVQRRGGVSLDNTPWSSHPFSAISPPQPVLPDINQERMWQIDEQILATLRAFDNHALAGPSPYERSDRLPRESDATPRRKTFSLEPSPLNMPLEPEDSTTPVPYSVGRRGSAPTFGEVSPESLSRRGSSDEQTSWHAGTDIAAKADAWIIPVHFGLPPSLRNSPGGAELTWPVLQDGSVRVRVLVTAASGVAETIARNFNMEEVRATVFGRPTLGIGRLDVSFDMPCPAPGSVLPVPGGLSPSFVQSPQSRRFPSGPLLSPMSPRSPMTLRQVTRQELPAEPMDKERARAYLPILGAVLDQQRRPIRPEDTITLPLPYAKAWRETVQYIYEGRPELLSESVKRNIIHLGGRVG